MHFWNLADTRIFSARHSTAFSHLGALESMSPLHTGTIFNREITNQKQKMQKTVYRLQKVACLR